MLYLTTNLTAAALNHRLQKGDINAAKEWLESYMSQSPERITLHQSFIAMTTARALIVVGKFNLALLLLEKIQRLATDFHRTLDSIELGILKSIALWKLKDKATAVEAMAAAVCTAEQYSYVRLFANEGAEVIPILQKLVGKISRNAESEVQDESFLRGLLLAAYENSKTISGLTSALAPAPVKLSPQQAQMLRLLSENKGNRQICEETGLKLNTVKAHLYKLYEKLEVATAADAVIMGKRLGLLEKE